jgi:hypothetical protein
LVAAHEANHLAARGPFDDLFEALPHQLLKLHPLFGHRRPPAAIAKRLLDLGVATPKDADDEIVLVVGLRLRRAATIELLQQGYQSIGDRGQLVAVAAFRLRCNPARVGSGRGIRRW